jgi:prophage regulatory protein
LNLRPLRCQRKANRRKAQKIAIFGFEARQKTPGLLPKTLVFAVLLPHHETNNFRIFPDIKFERLTMNQVLLITKIKSRTTLYRRVKRVSFSKPCQIGLGRIRWRERDVAQWVDLLSS